MITLKDKEFLARCLRCATMGVPVSSDEENWKRLRMLYFKDFSAFNKLLIDNGFEIVKTGITKQQEVAPEIPENSNEIVIQTL